MFFYYQIGTNDCGLASLAGLISFVSQVRFNYFLWLKELQYANQMLSLHDLQQIAETLQLKTKISFCNRSQLFELNLPCMLLINQHYLILWKINQSQVILFDPKYGIVEQQLNAWSWGEQFYCLQLCWPLPKKLALPLISQKVNTSWQKNSYLIATSLIQLIRYLVISLAFRFAMSHFPQAINGSDCVILVITTIGVLYGWWLSKITLKYLQTVYFDYLKRSTISLAELHFYQQKTLLHEAGLLFFVWTILTCFCLSISNPILCLGYIVYFFTSIYNYRFYRRKSYFASWKQLSNPNLFHFRYQILQTMLITVHFLGLIFICWQYQINLIQSSWCLGLVGLNYQLLRKYLCLLK